MAFRSEDNARLLRAADYGIALAYGAAMALLALLFVSRPLTELDFWWHLKTGQLIAETRALLAADPFNFTVGEGGVTLRERVILDGYWLWQVVADRAYRLWGFAGIRLLNAATLLATYLLLVLSLLRSRVRLRIMLPLLAASLVLFYQFYFLERPQIVSFALTAALVAFFVGIGRGDRPTWWLYPLMAIWGNCHSAVIVGAALLLVFAAGSSWDWRGEPARRRQVVLWCLGGVAASFLNPNGLDNYVATWEGMGRGVAEGIGEYMSTFAKFTTNKWVVLLWAVLLTHFAALWYSPWRRRAAVWLCSLFLAASSVLYARHIAFAAVALIPLTGCLLESGCAGMPRFLRRLGQAVFVVGAGLVLVCAGWQWRAVDGFKQRGEWAMVAHIYPQSLVKFLHGVNLSGNLFNDYDWGGYLLWALYPQYRLFIDGRGIDEQKLVDYRKIAYASQVPVNGRPEYEDLLERYQINVIAAKNEVGYTTVSPLLKNLLANPGWVPVYQDGLGYVLVKAVPANQALLRQYQIDKLLFVNRQIQGLSEYIRANPGDDRRYLVRGELLGYVGRFDEADRDFAMVRQLNPGNPILPVRLRELNALREQARRR